MPLRSYHHASRNPPTFLDHTLAHPYEVGLSIFQVLGGAMGLYAIAVPKVSVSPSFDQMPALVAGILCALLIGGGLLCLAGVYSDDSNLMLGYRRERSGVVLSATAWAMYAVVVAAAFPSAIIGWAFGVVLATCYGLRLAATFLEERHLRAGGA